MNIDSESIQPRVFGVGSTLGADRVGWLVLEQLQRKSTIQLPLYRLQAPLDLLNYTSSQDQLHDGTGGWESPSRGSWIIIDACVGDCMGEVYFWRWPEVPGNLNFASQVSSHGFGILDVLRMGQELGVLPDYVWIYGIDIGTESVLQVSCQQIEWEPCEKMQSAIMRCADQIASVPNSISPN